MRSTRRRPSLIPPRSALGAAALSLSLLTAGAGCAGEAPTARPPSAGAPAVAAAAAPPTLQGALAPTKDGPDAARPSLLVQLRPVISGTRSPTDIQFWPGRPGRVVVLEKQGKAVVFDLPAAGGPGEAARVGELLSLTVRSRSEQGLLGLAFHPKFTENGKLYVNYSTDGGGAAGNSRISEFTVPAGGTQAGAERVILEVEQPYANHDAGQLAFGPDGLLYIGWGDGGAGGDPLDAGQDGLTRLGKMLRVDVDRPTATSPFTVPADNPFLGRADRLPEIWAMGLRNPWRYSFAPDGRLIVADVGQDTWEEVNLVASGQNLGWNRREGTHCFKPPKDCPSPEAGGLTDPIYTYAHGPEGVSITGGYVYTGARISGLNGKYVFGDFGSGRIWALELPPVGAARSGPAPVTALGRFDIQISTFGRDAEGELYVADFASGRIFALSPL